jgi:hypothetical protein
MRMKIHKHYYGVTSSNYMPPPTQVEVTGFSAKELLEIVFGVTIITQRCVKCGRIVVTRTAGKTGYEAR